MIIKQQALINYLLVFKDLAPEISRVLTHIFNQSLAKGEPSKDWRQVNIVPVYKKADNVRTDNYRQHHT